MEQNVAVYLDFENLAISAETVFSDHSQPLQLELVIAYASSKGNICLKKAYADWSKDIFSQYQSTLTELGFELIHMPGTNLQGKNGADVRLAIDVMDHLHEYPNIHTVIIGSGDSDFIPLIQRVQSRNRKVVIVGFEHSVANMVKKNSAEFKSLETMMRDAKLGPDPDKARTTLDYGRNLLLGIIQQSDTSEPILMARLKQQLLKLDPLFSEKNLGFSSFKQFLLAFEGDLIEKIDNSQSTLPFVYLKSGKQTQHANIKATAGNFLAKKIRYRSDHDQRLKLSYELVNIFHNGNGSLSMNDIFEKVSKNEELELPKADIRKYVNTLFTGGAFDLGHNHTNLPLLMRPLKLKRDIEIPEELDELYIRRVVEILQKRYHPLSQTEILELLFE